MEQQVVSPRLGIRPIGSVEDSLPPQLVGDAQAFEGTQPGDALSPVVVLAIADGSPIPGANSRMPRPITSYLFRFSSCVFAWALFGSSSTAFSSAAIAPGLSPFAFFTAAIVT